jgi:hypothetical protein
MTGRGSPSRSLLGSQADEIIDEDTNWEQLAEELDVEHLRNQDSHPEWHPSVKDFRPMVLSYLWAKVEKIAYSRIPEELDGRPKLIRSLGFDVGDLPSKSTFKPSRLQDRFEDLESTLDLAAKEIRQLSRERGSSIGNDLTTSSGSEDSDSKPSKRTIDRMLRRNGKEVLEEVEETVFPSFSLPRPNNAVYDDDELLTLETVATINNNAANQGGEQLADVKNPEPSDDDPYYKDGPTGETLLESIKQLSVEEIAEQINYALQKTYTRAKPKLEQLDNFDTDVVLALDITYVGYWADGDDIEWLQGAPKDKEYDRCFQFATAAIVGQHSHFTVAVLPLGSTDYAENAAYPGNVTQSYYIGDVTRRLLDIANEYVNIRTVVADREFYAADVVDAIEAENLRYIIPAPKRKRLKRYCNDFDEIKRGYSDEPRNEALYVEHEYVLRGKVKHGKARTRKTSNLVILPPDEDDDAHGRDEPQPFITNLKSLSDETAIDRRSAIRRIERYSNRAAIENTYTSIKACAAKTTSKEIAVRWFHFGFACIIYNMWLLVDLLTQDRVGMVETRKKPRIKLSRFLRWIDRKIGILI